MFTYVRVRSRTFAYVSVKNVRNVTKTYANVRERTHIYANVQERTVYVPFGNVGHKIFIIYTALKVIYL